MICVLTAIARNTGTVKPLVLYIPKIVFCQSLPGYILFIISFGFINSREFSNFSTNIHRFFLGIFNEAVSQTVIAGKGSWSTGNPISSIVVSTGWVFQYSNFEKTTRQVAQNINTRKTPHAIRSTMLLPCTMYLNPGIVLSEKNETISFFNGRPGEWFFLLRLSIYKGNWITWNKSLTLKFTLWNIIYFN